jgi:UDP-2,3-diacylglucosamine pyrophosphatase LpxH
MNRIINVFSVGAEKPFTLLHFTDVHLTLSDERDPEEIRALAEKRREKYTHSLPVLREAARLSAEGRGLLVNTGDMTDFISFRNHEFIRRFTEENDCFFICGNHDFRPMGGMQYDVPACQAENLERVQRLYRNDIRFCSRVVNGVNLVGMDDAYYRFEPWEAERLKAEVARGMPIILFLHVPLFHEDLFRLMVQGRRKHASLVAVPESMMTEYPPERYEQQIADPLTRELTEYIKSEPAIRLVVAGHNHKSLEMTLADRLPQLVTSVDEIREIRIR